MLEVKHNTLGDFYCLLDEEGQATWYLISAAMEMGEIPGIMGASERRWVAEAELERQAIEGDPDTPVAYGLRRIDTISEPDADPVPPSQPVIDPPPPSQIGLMTCSGSPLSGPLCRLEFSEIPVTFGPSMAMEYHLRLDNAGDARLVAAEDDTALGAFRLDYH